MEYAIMTNNLYKNINGKSIISDMNLRVKKGEIYGFLGPQNAGKTTMSNLLSNLIKPSMGEIYILGENIFNLQYRKLKKVGIMIDKAIFYNNLTVMENLQIHCEYIGGKDIKIINSILEALNLADISKKVVRNLEAKEKRRLSIARSLVSIPELVILDEPFKGFSTIEINNILQIFKSINYEYGTTIFITAETLASLYCLADTIGIITSGTIVEEVSMSNIKNTNRISI